MNDLNLDSRALTKIMGIIGSPSQNIGGDSGNELSVLDINRLTESELHALYNNSKTIAKIVTRYPELARSTGYVYKDSSIIERNLPNVLEMFYNASIEARLYGWCNCLMITESGGNDYTKPYKLGDRVLGYETNYIEYERKNDYYIPLKFGSVSEEDLARMSQVHYTRLLFFYGDRTLRRGVNLYNDDKYQSLIQSTIVDFRNYIMSIENARRVLGNASYLLLGIDNLGTLLRTTQGRDQLLSRLLSINVNRSANRAIAFDKQNESLSFISQTLAGFKDIIEETRFALVASSNLPYAELFGDTRGNSLGTGVNNQLVQRYLLAEKTKTFVENNWVDNYLTYLSRKYNNTGTIEIPLQVTLTQLEKAELEEKAANRTEKLIRSGVITTDEARSNYRGDEFTLDITLDNTLNEDALTDPEDVLRLDNEAIAQVMDEALKLSPR